MGLCASTSENASNARSARWRYRSSVVNSCNRCRLRSWTELPVGSALSEDGFSRVISDS